MTAVANPGKPHVIIKTTFNLLPEEIRGAGVVDMGCFIKTVLNSYVFYRTYFIYDILYDILYMYYYIG